MVLITAGALLVGAVLTFFAVSAVSTLAHWVAVSAAFLIGSGLIYHLIEGDLSEYFDILRLDGVFEILSAGIVGGVAGFVSFRLIESVFAALGFVGALVVALLAVASFVFGPGVVASVLGSFVSALTEYVGGE